MNCLEFKNIRVVLTDIEGTTSDIRFVKDVMFPYSAKKLPEYMRQNVSGPDVEGKIKHLLNLIKQDVKDPELKTIQGKIWKTAFESGEFKAHVYKDVPPCLKDWKDSGIRLAVYSSGSVQAQKLYFKHTTDGDLTYLFTNHFDLECGGKKEKGSYEKISRSMECPPENMLFLSDIPEELAAASAAGYQVTHLIRPGTSVANFPIAASFNEISLNGLPCV